MQTRSRKLRPMTASAIPIASLTLSGMTPCPPWLAGPLGDLSAFDPAGLAWTALGPDVVGGPPPSPRCGAGAVAGVAVAGAASALVLFGGVGTDGARARRPRQQAAESRGGGGSGQRGAGGGRWRFRGAGPSRLPGKGQPRVHHGRGWRREGWVSLRHGRRAI